MSGDLVLHAHLEWRIMLIPLDLLYAQVNVHAVCTRERSHCTLFICFAKHLVKVIRCCASYVVHFDFAFLRLLKLKTSTFNFSSKLVLSLTPPVLHSFNFTVIVDATMLVSSVLTIFCLA